jgi:16S rRNA (guanine966-N2)-methyltransferase
MARTMSGSVGKNTGKSADGSVGKSVGRSVGRSADKSAGGRPPKSAAASAPRRVSSHRIRIIGGQWKRTPLTVLDAPGLRPTPDRIRETLFNWLDHLLDGAWSGKRCLDLFSGSGALGFEAASRGAQEVVLVESNSKAVQLLEESREKLQATQIKILQGDAARVAARLAAEADPGGNEESRRFDLVFLDPPYHLEWLPRLLPLCHALLRSNGLVYAESETPLSPELMPWLQGWEIVRADKAGMVFYHLLVRIPTT